MKRRIFTVLLCGLLLIALAGCTKKEEDLEFEKESDARVVTDGDVTLYFKDDAIFLKNNSDKDYSYSNEYWLEKLQDEKWYVLKPVKDVGFYAEVLDLKAGEEKRLEINWQDIYGKLDSGIYRVVKTIGFENEDGKKESFEVAAEFNIGEDNIKGDEIDN